MLPISVVAGAVLVASAPDQASRISSVIFAFTASLLFGVSGLLHLGTWSPKLEELLRRADHGNIYLIIAGTYTPFAVLALPPDQGRVMLAIVWIGAIAGVVFRVFWLAAPRWLSTTLYVVVGWVAVFFIPEGMEVKILPVVLEHRFDVVPGVVVAIPSFSVVVLWPLERPDRVDISVATRALLVSSRVL